MSISAREEILQRIRTALPGQPSSPEASHAAIERNYFRKGTFDRHAVLELFVDRLVDYDTDVIQLEGPSLIAQSVADSLHKTGEERLIIGPGLPPEWIPGGIELIVDEHLSTEEIDRAQVVLTTCEAAVAATGTIFLVHGGAQGRRAPTLLPDHHICIVRRNQVYELVPEALAALAPFHKQPITSISGPSATADIEMNRIRGVHGPRRLTVILYGEY
ncbi:MAG TPA: LUD domain-containing protein [Granulicella sp.]